MSQVFSFPESVQPVKPKLLPAPTSRPATTSQILHPIHLYHSTHASRFPPVAHRARELRGFFACVAVGVRKHERPVDVRITTDMQLFAIPPGKKQEEQRDT
jgi:hypothetical protein